MSAGRDGTLRMWTLKGQHVGTFSRDTWKAVDVKTYGATPQTALNEPPRDWPHPPKDGQQIKRQPTKRRETEIHRGDIGNGAGGG